MAGAATVQIIYTVSGLDDQDFTIDSGECTLTVPVEARKGHTIVATAQTTALQLSSLVPDIALAKMYGLYIKAQSGTIYVQLDTAGTTTFAAAAAHKVINVGEPAFISLNPAGNLGVAIDAAAVTDTFSWAVIGKA